MEQLYAQIKAVPGVWDKLEECLLNHGEREKAILAMARLAAIQGRWEDAIVHTKAAADAGNEEAVWLQGNLAMQRGDFAVAHFAFDKYWYQTVDGSERQQVASEVCNEYHGQLEACIHALIMRGLWREAFKKASEREEPTPTEQFVSILHLDVFGDKPNEVIENYRRLLAEHTGYWLARRRLEFLDGTD